MLVKVIANLTGLLLNLKEVLHGELTEIKELNLKELYLSKNLHTDSHQYAIAEETFKFEEAAQYCFNLRMKNFFVQEEDNLTALFEKFQIKSVWVDGYKSKKSRWLDRTGLGLLTHFSKTVIKMDSIDLTKPDSEYALALTQKNDTSEFYYEMVAMSEARSTVCLGTIAFPNRKRDEFVLKSIKDFTISTLKNQIRRIDYQKRVAERFIAALPMIHDNKTDEPLATFEYGPEVYLEILAWKMTIDLCVKFKKLQKVEDLAIINAQLLDVHEGYEILMRDIMIPIREPLSLIKESYAKLLQEGMKFDLWKIDETTFLVLFYQGETDMPPCLRPLKEKIIDIGNFYKLRFIDFVWIILYAWMILYTILVWCISVIYSVIKRCRNPLRREYVYKINTIRQTSKPTVSKVKGKEDIFPTTLRRPPKENRSTYIQGKTIVSQVTNDTPLYLTDSRIELHNLQE